MPLKLKEPRKGKSPNFSIRGTYLGIRVDLSCKTDRRSVARGMLKRLRVAIERGEYPARAAAEAGEQPHFLRAANLYMQSGGEARYMARLIRHFGVTPLSAIDQAAIDDAAATIYPNVTAATRNRCVYTPVQAVLKRAGAELDLKRPLGAKGRTITDALNPADASAVITAAGTIDAEHALLLTFLLYTGCRLGEALGLRHEHLQLEENPATARVRMSKNGDPREIRLRADLAAQLRAHPQRADSRRVFRFHQGGHLKHLLMRAKLKALGLPCPARRPKGWRQPPNRLAWLNHHSFCHTWATWFRRYAGGDVDGLVGTKRWKSRKSAARYAHVVFAEEWQRVDSLPAIGGENGERTRDAG